MKQLALTGVILVLTSTLSGPHADTHYIEVDPENPNGSIWLFPEKGGESGHLPEEWVADTLRFSTGIVLYTFSLLVVVPEWLEVYGGVFLDDSTVGNWGYYRCSTQVHNSLGHYEIPPDRGDLLYCTMSEGESDTNWVDESCSLSSFWTLQRPDTAIVETQTATLDTFFPFWLYYIYCVDPGTCLGWNFGGSHAELLSNARWVLYAENRDSSATMKFRAVTDSMRYRELSGEIWTMDAYRLDYALCGYPVRIAPRAGFPHRQQVGMRASLGAPLYDIRGRALGERVPGQHIRRETGIQDRGISGHAQRSRRSVLVPVVRSDRGGCSGVAVEIR